MLLPFSSDHSKHEESFLSSEEEPEEEVKPKINLKQQMAQRFGNDYVEELLGSEQTGGKHACSIHNYFIFFKN